MSDNPFLHGWYVDSCPGNANATLKCGEIIVSTGISGTSTVTEEGPDDVPLDTLTRAKTTPGTTLTSETLPDAWSFNLDTTVWFDGHSALYTLPRAANSNSISISFWYNMWSDSLDDDGPGSNGLIFGSPTKEPASPPIDPTSGDPIHRQETLEFNLVNHAGGAITNSDINAVMNNGTDFIDAQYSSGVNYATDPFDEMQGWCHIMFAAKRESSNVYVTFYINDTQIVADHLVSDKSGAPAFPWHDLVDYSADGYDHFWNIGGRPDRRGDGSETELAQTRDDVDYNPTPGSFLLPSTWRQSDGHTNTTLGLNTGTLADSMAAHGYFPCGGGSSWAAPSSLPQGYPTTYTIGCLGFPTTYTFSTSGPFFDIDNDCVGKHTVTYTYWMNTPGDPTYRGFQPSDGKGFRGAVTELWIAPGQFIDWTVLENRYKFHTSDDPTADSPSIWAPVDLGQTGKLPTGLKPLIYLTGRSNEFNYNRAKKGALLPLYRNSVGGLVGQLKDYLKKPGV